MVRNFFNVAEIIKICSSPSGAASSITNVLPMKVLPKPREHITGKTSSGGEAFIAS
jgi:hypothetical protein